MCYGTKAWEYNMCVISLHKVFIQALYNVTWYSRLYTRSTLCWRFEEYCLVLFILYESSLDP